MLPKAAWQRDLARAGQESDSSGAVVLQSVGEDRAMANVLQTSSFAVSLALFFIAGIGLAFTPCVFPMVPILSTIIVGEGEGLTKTRAVTLSGSYVLGMALTYALVGLLVGLFGAELNLQATLQSPWVLTSFAVVFVLLSGAMFGFYELALPQSAQQWIDERSQTGRWPVSICIRDAPCRILLYLPASCPCRGTDLSV